MPSAWLRVSNHALEIGIAVLFIALCSLTFYEALRLGPGWGEQGPQPGFFPFVLALLMVVGALSVLYLAVRQPDRRPFFEASEEVEDLLKVGLPIAVAVALIPWAGMYLTSGLYTAYFMAWYGGFRWYKALAGGVLLPVVLWATLREGFNIPMPMSMLYRSGVLPF